MLRKISEEESKYIYILKALAIFCVVCAHMYPVPEPTTKINAISSEILNYIGTMGVPIFYIVSGYLFAGNKRTIKDFWKSKFINVIVPWIFCYVLLYIYITIRKGGFSLVGFLRVIIGYYSSAYYLTVLLIFYCVFWFMNSEKIIYILGLLSIFSMICTGWLFGISFLNELCGTYYLNPLNWTFFFASGMMLRKHGLNLKLLSFKFFPLFLIASVVYFLVMGYLNESIWYFSKYAIIGHIINIGLLFSCAGMIQRIGLNFAWGQYSYTIYLTNQLIAGLFIEITNHFPPIGIFTLLRPVLVIFCIILVVMILNKFTGERHTFVHMLLGIRRRKIKS